MKTMFWQPSNHQVGHKSLSTSGIQKILIVATRQIGDVLCTTPLIRRTREIWPDAVIDVLGYEKTMGMLAGNPDIQDIIESSEHPKWPEYRRLIRRIFRRYDLAIVTQPSDRPHIYGLLAAPKRVGIVPARVEHSWWKNALAMATISMDGASRHVIVDRLRLMSFFDKDKGRPVVTPPAQENLPIEVRSLLSEPYVLFHATPMWPYKRWKVSAWVDLAIRVNSLGHRVFLTGSGSKADVEFNQSIQQQITAAFPESRVHNLAGLISLRQLTTLLTEGRAYVGVDTSVTHQAAASGVPVVALFGPTTPINFGPWPKGFEWSLSCDSPWVKVGRMMPCDSGHIQSLKNVTVLQGPGACVPCMKAGCHDRNDSESDCLDRLSVDAVWKVLEPLLQPKETQ
jgi:heptosyltransferase-3